LFNLAGATLNVTGQWDEPLCKPLLATPSPQTVVRYPPSITLVDAKTRVTVNTFSPCGDLRIDACNTSAFFYCPMVRSLGIFVF